MTQEYLRENLQTAIRYVNSTLKAHKIAGTLEITSAEERNKHLSLVYLRLKLEDRDLKPFMVYFHHHTPDALEADVLRAVMVAALG